MKKLLLGSSAFLGLAGALVLAQGPVLAAPVDDLDREKALLRKENADLRELLRMRDENAALRYRLGQQGVEAPAPLPVAQPPRLRAASPAAPSREGLRADSATPRAAPSIFESYAADLPVKAPAPMRSALYDWTGFYVGANIGYSVGNDRVSQTLTAATVVDTSFTNSAIAPRGALGGFQIGYNWQGGRNWLVGFETDFQAANQTDKACTISCLTNSTSTETFTLEQKLEYFGTFRGRLGVVNDNILFYATGGAAYGRVVETAASAFSIQGVGGSSAANTIGEIRFGWAAGGGIEAALWGNWTAKAEYLYLNLGDMKPNVFATNIPGTPPTPFTLATNSTIRDHIVRAGINYRFGGDAPLSAYASARGMEANPAYASVYNWTGIYAGANVGYSAGVSRLSQVSPTPPGAFSTFDSVITPKGFAGGVQVGYNWQGGRNWLVGFEADIQGTNQSDTACAPLVCFSQATTTTSGNDALTAQQQIDWFGTVRGRLGVVNNNILFFATGGVAFGQVKETIAENFTLGTAANFTAVSNTFNQVGWAAGGGIEAALWGNWTGKAEYLYLDLGTIKSTFNDGTLTINNTSTVRDHIFRAGVNYRFSGEPGTVVAKY